MGKEHLSRRIPTGKICGACAGSLGPIWMVEIRPSHISLIPTAWARCIPCWKAYRQSCTRKFRREWLPRLSYPCRFWSDTPELAHPEHLPAVQACMEFSTRIPAMLEIMWMVDSGRPDDERVKGLVEVLRTGGPKRSNYVSSYHKIPPTEQTPRSASLQA